jgi:PAS domain S-box-containing protein
MRFLKRNKKPKSTDQSKLDRARRLETMEKNAASSLDALTNVANQTKEIAEDITLKLRNDLIDKMREIELTANIISDALLICSYDGLILSMNPVSEGLLQFSLTPEHSRYIQSHIKGSEDGYWEGLSNRTEATRIMRGDGAEITCTINVAKLDKLGGTTTYILLIHVLALDETIENASIVNKGTLILTDGMVTGVNEEIGRILGYSANEFLGMTMNDLVSGPEQIFVNHQLSNIDIESTFDTVVMTKMGNKLYCKMSITFVTLGSNRVAVITLDGIGEDVADRKIDVVRCFGEDYFFRSSTFISHFEDMFLYLSPDLTVRYATDNMKRKLKCEGADIVGLALKDILTPTEYTVAELHFMSLNPRDCERTISVHLKNTNTGAHQEWTDRAFYDDDGNLTEYRRSGTERI